MKFLKILMLIAPLLAATPAQAQRPADIFSQANALYRNGKFQEAAAIYLQLSQTEPQNPAYHYNLANAYYKTGSLGRAVLSYRRAFRLMPRNPDIRYNLNLALKKTGEDLVPPGVPEAAHKLYYWLSYSELAGFTLACCWIACLAGAFVLLKKTPLSGFLAPAAKLFALLGLIAGAWLLARHTGEAAHDAVIVDGIVELRSGPGENFGAAATIPEGHTVELLDSKEDWYEAGIRKEGIKGWIKKKSAERI